MILSAQLQKVLPLDVYDPQMLTQEDQWYRVHSFDWRQNTQKWRVSLTREYHGDVWKRQSLSKWSLEIDGHNGILKKLKINTLRDYNLKLTVLNNYV